MFANRHGLAALLKEGGQQYSGVSEVALKNIEACRAISNITQTSMGPNSMNKLLISHLGKQMVTSDASVMSAEMEVQHPAAKMLIMASKMQDDEYGDATNMVLVFGGELLNQAENLLKQGIHIADIIRGYDIASEKCLEYLKECTCWTLNNPLDCTELAKGIRTCLGSKHLGIERHLSELVAKAAVAVMPKNIANFNVENIRVCKLIGGNLQETSIVHGMAIMKEPHGAIKSKQNAKVMVLGCGLEITGTEAKGTVMISSAKELIAFSKGEEDQMEKAIKEIKAAGVDAIIVNGPISDLAQHFCDAEKILTLKVQSKFDIRRICKTLQTTAVVRLGAPMPEEIGLAESIEVEEISSKKVTIVKGRESKVASIILRGSTPNTLDEIERSIDDAISCIKSITKSGRFVAGAGAVEMELASKLQTFASGVSGLDQYAVRKFAESFECVPRILAENAGHDSIKAITTLYSRHRMGCKYEGVDVGVMGEDWETGRPSGQPHCRPKTRGMTLDACKADIFDHLETKHWAISLAVDAVLTVLRLDHIIVARPAGGPKPRAPGGGDMDD
eukprot:GHVS01082235.1.p1 GENE.GHVS01082235.1~~GHVS01082235.1.p1  ORF type:complete len:561 (-),score=70.05 GHVS01082235.1:217-1899(-)